MQLFVIVQLILTFLYVYYLIYQYSLPQVNIYVKILVYLTWLFCFIIVVLLPYDIYYSFKDQNAMNIIWKSIYYFIFVLTWVLLPIAQEYQSSGQFTPKQKLKRAIINNLIIYAIFAVIGILFMVYLIFKSQLNLAQLMPILMAASNAFGMCLVVIFLSYGLVAVPKKLWRQRKYQLKLKHKQFIAASLSKKKQKVVLELQLKVKQLLWQKQKNQKNQSINHILSLVPQKYLNRWKRNIPNLGQNDIIKIHKQIKELLLQNTRLESRWDFLLHQTFILEDIVQTFNSPNTNYLIQSTFYPHSKYEFINKLTWLWYCKLKIYVVPALSVFLSLFAFFIIIAQLAIFLPLLRPFNIFNKLTEIQSFFTMNCLLLIVFAYIVFCVYYALFKLKFASFYGLYWNKQTDAASLMFYAINCSRVSTPLGYNFLQIVNDKNTSFISVMGQANVVPIFGQTYNIIFPLLLIILIIFNAFDIYSLIAKQFGFQKIAFESDFGHQNIDQGKRILQKARTEVQTKILNSNTKDLNYYKSYQSELETNYQATMSKDSTSSDAIKISNNNNQIYFNQHKNMQDFAKIMNM